MGIIYVLELHDNKWYVGYTENLKQRMFFHFCTHASTAWVKKYLAVRVDLIIKDVDICMENFVTLLYMIDKGWTNVRGGGWCYLRMLGPPKSLRSEEQLKKEEKERKALKSKRRKLYKLFRPLQDSPTI